MHSHSIINNLISNTHSNKHIQEQNSPISYKRWYFLAIGVQEQLITLQTTNQSKGFKTLNNK